MPPSRPMKIPKSVIDLMLPVMLVALGVVDAELFPGIRAALLDTQRDATAVFVDVEHHDLHLIAHGNDLRGVNVLVGPVHLGHVHQTFNAFLDLGKAAVIGEVGDGGRARALPSG